MPESGQIFVDEFALTHFVVLWCTFDVGDFILE